MLLDILVSVTAVFALAHLPYKHSKITKTTYTTLAMFLACLAIHQVLGLVVLGELSNYSYFLLWILPTGLVITTCDRAPHHLTLTHYIVNFALGLSSIQIILELL